MLALKTAGASSSEDAVDSRSVSESTWCASAAVHQLPPFSFLFHHCSSQPPLPAGAVVALAAWPLPPLGALSPLPPLRRGLRSRRGDTTARLSGWRPGAAELAPLPLPEFCAFAAARAAFSALRSIFA